MFFKRHFREQLTSRDELFSHNHVNHNGCKLPVNRRKHVYQGQRQECLLGSPQSGLRRKFFGYVSIFWHGWSWVEIKRSIYIQNWCLRGRVNLQDVGWMADCIEALVVATLCEKRAHFHRYHEAGEDYKGFLFHFHPFVKKCSEVNVVRHSENMQWHIQHTRFWS